MTNTDIPETYRHLLDAPICATMVTLMPDGTPHASVVWRKYEDGLIWVCMAQGAQKVRNLKCHPHVAFTIMDPQDPYRYLEIRGVLVELVENANPDILDEIAVLYTGQKYYGVAEPEENRKDPLALAKIKPTRIRANA